MKGENKNEKNQYQRKNKKMVKMCRRQSGKNNGSDCDCHDRKRSCDQRGKLAGGSICNGIVRRAVTTYQCGRIARM